MKMQSYDLSIDIISQTLFKGYITQVSIIFLVAILLLLQFSLNSKFVILQYRHFILKSLILHNVSAFDKSNMYHVFSLMRVFLLDAISMNLYYLYHLKQFHIIHRHHLHYLKQLHIISRHHLYYLN